MSKSMYDMIYEIEDMIGFDRIEGHSLLGDIRSEAYKHPIQYRALTNVRPGDDDPFEGVGWTPNQALRDLLRRLKRDNVRDLQDRPVTNYYSEGESMKVKVAKKESKYG